MKLKTVQILSIASLIGSAANLASAADQGSPWSLSISGGDSVDTSGNLTSARSATVDLGKLDPALAGSSGALSLDKLRYNDIFERRYDFGAELGYAFSDSLQAFARFDYESLGGRTTQLGSIASATLPREGMGASFADANNYSLDLGARYFWRTGTAWRPFAGAALGATHLDGTSAIVRSSGGAIDSGEVRFTRPGTVFNQMAEAGIEYQQSDAFGVSLSVDANHAGAPHSADDARFSAAGLNPGSEAEDRWSFPVTIAASYHF